MMGSLLQGATGSNWIEAVIELAAWLIFGEAQEALGSCGVYGFDSRYPKAMYVSDAVNGSVKWHCSICSVIHGCCDPEAVAKVAEEWRACHRHHCRNCEAIHLEQ